MTVAGRTRRIIRETLALDRVRPICIEVLPRELKVRVRADAKSIWCPTVRFSIWAGRSRRGKTGRGDGDMDLDRFRVTPETERLMREARQARIAAYITRLFEQMVSGMTREKERELAAMSYSSFLETHYWWVLGRYVRLLHNNRCDFCRSPFNLQVHHRTYDHVGAEYRHLDNLALLCNRCHLAE